MSKHEVKYCNSRVFWSDPFYPAYTHYIQCFFDANKGMVAMELFHLYKVTPEHRIHTFVTCKCAEMQDGNQISSSSLRKEPPSEVILKYSAAFQIGGGVFPRAYLATFYRDLVTVYPDPERDTYHVCVNTLVFHQDPFGLLV